MRPIAPAFAASFAGYFAALGLFCAGQGAGLGAGADASAAGSHHCAQAANAPPSTPDAPTGERDPGRSACEWHCASGSHGLQPDALAAGPATGMVLHRSRHDSPLGPGAFRSGPRPIPGDRLPPADRLLLHSTLLI